MQESSSIKHWAEDDKPREKLLSKGKEALSNAELLAIILGSGQAGSSVIDLSRRVLSSVSDDLKSLSRSTVAELQKIKGIGPAKAISIVATLELANRRNQVRKNHQPLISSSVDAYDIIGPMLSTKSYEEFWILLLNRRNQVIKPYKISEGGVSGTVADPKRIFKTALEHSASGMILCHNHPSGNLKPSQADIALTRKIKAGGSQLDIAILDHLIIAGDSYYSFADEGNI
ncbi:JAB domain-containing protein [bacterium]|nr:JAB domain-containing protein [bacterium]